MGYKILFFIVLMSILFLATVALNKYSDDTKYIKVIKQITQTPFHTEPGSYSYVRPDGSIGGYTVPLENGATTK